MFTNAGGVTEDRFHGLEDDAVRRPCENIVESEHYLALLGLYILNLQLPSAICVPLCLDAVDQILGGVSVAIAIVKYSTGSWKISSLVALSLSL